MLYWGIFMFILGGMAFLDSFFNYGDIFRRVNSVFFMLLALGVLIRTRLLVGKGKIEKLIERNQELEHRVAEIKRPADVKEEEPEPVH